MFKLNNPLLVIDLEATAGKNPSGYQTNNFILDIGAVLLDTNLTKVDSFSSLVQPEEEIIPMIEELTGITSEMTKEAPLFPQAAEAWESWIMSSGLGSLKKIRLCAWGNYFDIPLLRRVYNFYNKSFPFNGAALDIRSMAFLWHSLSGRRTDKVSVEGTAREMKINLPSKMHRALIDAQIETEILKRVWHDLQGIFIENPSGPSEALFLRSDSER